MKYYVLFIVSIFVNSILYFIFGMRLLALLVSDKLAENYQRILLLPIAILCILLPFLHSKLFQYKPDLYRRIIHVFRVDSEKNASISQIIMICVVSIVNIMILTFISRYFLQ